MKSLRHERKRALLLFLLLAAATALPVWTTGYFVNQDGPGHVHAARVMLELLRGNPVYGEVLAFNSPAVPNSSGHWLMVPLLLVFSPLAVTKLMITLTLTAFAAAVAHLRRVAAGLPTWDATGVLFGFALGLNWLWLLGSYNFVIGAALAILLAAEFYRRRDEPGPRLAALTAVLLAGIFVSHVIAFAVAAAAVAVISLSARREKHIASVLWTGAAGAALLPLVIVYRSLGRAGGEPFAPAWRNLASPYSPVAWLRQFATLDPFVMISRKTLPFTNLDTLAAAVMTPLVWIVAAVAMLVAADLMSGGGVRRLATRSLAPFAALAAFLLIAALFGPDDFGLTNGSILRERLFLFALVFLVPLYAPAAAASPRLRLAAHAALAVAVAFQILVLFDYGRRADAEAREFLAAATALAPGESFAAVVVADESLRFHANPAGQLNNYLAADGERFGWDNYEYGHYLFPLVMKRGADKEFAFCLTTSNVFERDRAPEVFAERLARLDGCFRDDAVERRVRTLVVRGRDARVDAVLARWFDLSAPVYESATVRVVRHLP